MKEGKISEQGTYQKLIDNEGHFSNFLLQYLIEETKKDEAKKDNDEREESYVSKDLNSASTVQSTEEEPYLQRNGSIRSRSSVHDLKNHSSDTDHLMSLVPEGKNLISS